MKKRGRKVSGGGMMSGEEKLIVRYIVERLENAYRNANGKAEYARNMDQVMKDIFGVKKFTKTLERAHFSESVMANLMRRMDTKTLWAICRNGEHYQMLVTLVAMDFEIVKLNKKREKILNLEPTDRPSVKYKRLTKELKKTTKTYNQCVKMFRNIFDIHKVDGSPNQLIDMAASWKDRYGGGDSYGDIFYGDDIFSDLDGGYSSMESMDEFVRNEMHRKSGGAHSKNNRGILGIFDNDRSSFDDIGFDEEEEDENDPEIRVSEVMRTLAQLGITPDTIAAMRGKAPTARGHRPTGGGVASAMGREFDFGIEPDEDELVDDDDDISELQRGMIAMQQAMVNQNELMMKLIGALGEQSDDDEIPMEYPVRAPQSGVMSMDDVIRLSNETAASVPQPTVVQHTEETTTVQLSTVKTPPVPGKEVDSPDAE